MNDLDLKSFDKERIKSRILKRAAEFWGFREAEMDSFDPLVKLLIESYAGELEKISFEIGATQNRILERLTGLISPELDIVKPAFGIVQSNPLDADFIADRNTQLLYKNTDDRKSGKEAAVVFLSPVQDYRLYKATVAYCYARGRLFRFENGISKTYLIDGEVRKPTGNNDLWIGLDMEEYLEFPDGLAFYFDWFNEPRKELFLEYLALTEWYSYDGRMINTQKGLLPATGNNQKILADFVLDISAKLEKEVSGLFYNHFITLRPGDGNGKLQKSKYPPGLENRLLPQDQKNFKKDLVWICVKFPEFSPSDLFDNMVCAINCFPVLNRKINRINHKAQQILNVIALETSDSFLAIRDVRNDHDRIYSQIPLAGPEENLPATYSLRSGINRLDQRQARELLKYLLELLHDESSSFAAMGEDFMTSQITELNQNIARLEQRMNRPNGNSSSPYMILTAPERGETLFIEYWSTLGADANGIPAGAKLSLYSGSYLDNNTIYLMSTLSGGREKPRGERRISLLKKSLLSRGRVVTLEDIRIYCQEALAEKARDIQISRKFERSNIPNQGFIRTFVIEIIPAGDFDYGNEEWNKVCAELKYSLESASTGNWPFKVYIKKQP